MFNLGTWWSVNGEEVPRATDTLPSWSWMAWRGKRICPIKSKDRLRKVVCHSVFLNEPGQKCLRKVSDDKQHPSNSRVILRAMSRSLYGQNYAPGFTSFFWAQASILDAQNSAENIRRIRLNRTDEQGCKEWETGYVYGEPKSICGHHEFILLQTESPIDGAPGEFFPSQHHLLLISLHDGIARRERSADIDIDEWE